METGEQPARHTLRGMVEAARGRAIEWDKAIPIALLVVLAVGLALRALMWMAVRPVEMNNVDSIVYLRMAQNDLFVDPVRPAGYSMFLRALHAISDQIEWTVFIQHVAGVCSGLLLYAVVRRVGGPIWAAVCAAAAVLLSLDQIYLEHSFLAETLFTLLLIGVLYCCVRALDDPRDLLWRLTTRMVWIAGAGLLLGLCAWVRTVGVTLAPFFALWFMLAIPGAWRARLGRGLLAGAVAAAVVLGYGAWHNAERGYFGLTDGSGRVLLGRVSPFADCSKFDVPAGAEAVCPRQAPDDRPGADYYIWDATSPAWRKFGPLPGGNEVSGEFAKRAIIAQPFDYARVVATDTLRHFFPHLGSDRPTGTPYVWMRIDRPDTGQQAIEQLVDGYYDAGSFTVSGLAGTLGDVQDVLRVHEVLMLIAVILAGLGIWYARGRLRWGLVLLIGTGLELLILPSLTATYNARYAVPVGGLYVAAGALGLWVLLDRYAARIRRRLAADAASPNLLAP